MSVSIAITGIKELDEVFRMMPLALNHKVMGTAFEDAAKPLVEKEKLLAPEGPTGNLVDSIGAKRISISRAGYVGEVHVGPRRGGKYKGYAGHLVEYGTKQRKTRKGANRGVMPAEPFAEPAFKATKNLIESRIQASIAKVVVRTMNRYVKKYS